MSFLKCFSLIFVKSSSKQEDVEETHQVVDHVPDKSKTIIDHEICLRENIYVTKNARDQKVTIMIA